jgi:hypothetical protein
VALPLQILRDSSAGTDAFFQDASISAPFMPYLEIRPRSSLGNGCKAGLHRVSHTNLTFPLAPLPHPRALSFSMNGIGIIIALS